MNEIYRDVCERLNWSVTSDADGNIELEKHSPAGEGFIITVGKENFVDNVKAYAASFDQGERLEARIAAAEQHDVERHQHEYNNCGWVW